MFKNSTCVLLVAALVLLLLVLVIVQTPWCSTDSTESYDATYAYQFNKRPAWLQRWNASRDQRLKALHDMCNARVAAECAGLSYDQRIGCVLNNLEKCKKLNGL